MARFLKNRRKSLGQVPGSLIFIGRKKMEKSQMEFFTYDRENYTEEEIQDLSTVSLNGTGKIKWLNIAGLQDTELIAAAGNLFNLSPLAMEDILNTGQRPKVMDEENNLIIFLKEIDYDREKKRIKTDHVTIFLSQGSVVTFQEQPGDPFDPVRDRIRNARGRIRTTGADYLVYTLLDTLVDGYIQQIEAIGTDMEELEEKIINNPDKETLEQIYQYKKEVSYMRKSVRPMKEIMLGLLKNENSLFHKKTIAYLKDLEDLVNETVDSVEIYYNMANDLISLYHANTTQRVNEVMRTLTIYTVIFIPLTFLVGVYGTNFDHLPELHYRYGYLYMWIAILLIAIGMVIYFRRRRWL